MAIFRMISTLLFIGGIFYAANKGYGYAQAVEQISFEFAKFGDLKLKKWNFYFKLTINAINPTKQPINVDAIFLDIYLEEKDRESEEQKLIPIAQIRELSFNKSIAAKSNTPLVLPIKSNLEKAGGAYLETVVGFFKGQSPEGKNIRIIGNITAERLKIPVNETLSSLTA